jgi:hypothetical protein
MITAILALLSTRWVQYIIGSIAFVALATWGVHTYNVKVSTKAVAAALVKERAVTVPVIKELAERVAARDATIGDIKAKSETERARQIAVVDLKDKELKNALTQNKALKTDLGKLRGADADFQRLLDTITANNHSATGASASTRLKQLGAAHQQCERALRESDGDLAETLGRLDEALAVVRALKN